MQMTLTITAESPAEMVTVLKALQVSGVETPVQLQTASAPPPVQQEIIPPRRGRPPKVATPVVEPPSAVSVEPAPAPAKLTVVPKEARAEPEEKKAITIMDVRKALTEYLAANNETAAATLLAKHGKTDRLSKLEPQYFEAVYYAAVTPAVKAEFDDDISTVGSA